MIIGPRHHDVLDPDFVEPQHVAQHRAFLLREDRLGSRILQRIFDVVPQRRRPEPEHGP